MVSRNTNGEKVIYFKQPKDILSFFPTLMPNTDLYFVHPSLEQLIQACNQGSYHTYNYIVVGHHYQWNRKNKLIYQIQKLCESIQNDDLEELVFELLQNFILSQKESVKSIFQKLDAIFEDPKDEKTLKIIFLIQQLISN